MFHINDLVFRYGGRVLFDHATLAVDKGWRVGLVGPNGTGKTTLLRLISGELAPDGGEVRLVGRGRLGHIAQHAPSGDASLIDTVLAADKERSALLAELETCDDAARIADIHERLRSIEAHSAPARAARILSGLGFSEERQQEPCSSLSGGWRMRVALAALLFSEPDVLLLDEPTNHLDLEATLWLESYLGSFPGTLFIVSHERSLLNTVVNRIAHLEGGKLTLYSGNYDRFERTRRERLEREAATNAKITAQRRHMQAFVDRFRYKASKARQAQSRLKALEKLQPIVSVAERQTISFDFPAPQALSPPVLIVEEGAVGYAPGQPILSDLDLRFDMDDRVALLGANGNGKSTFAKLLSGRLGLQGGRMRRSPKLKVGYFAQDQAEELNLSQTAYESLLQLMPKEPETRLRAHLGRFGFSGVKADTPVKQLSGGERARLLFALMTREQPQLLILDEPTNHLDVDSREALIQALSAFEGAVLLISHDPHLVELVADRLWIAKDGGIAPFDGDLDDYRRQLLDQRRTERQQSRRQRDQDEAGATSKRDKRKAGAEARAAVAHLKKAAKEAERRLERLHVDKDRLEAKLADPALYNGKADEAAKLNQDLARLQEEIEAVEGYWMEAAEALSAAGGSL